MITESLPALKIHKLTQEQYERALAAGNIDENALYLTPDNGSFAGPLPSINSSSWGSLDEQYNTLCSLHFDGYDAQLIDLKCYNMRSSQEDDCIYFYSDIISNISQGNQPGSVVRKDYVDNAVGDIETALDNIIAIQEALIGGEAS